jgi:hypothetical protein
MCRVSERLSSPAACAVCAAARAAAELEVPPEWRPIAEHPRLQPPGPVSEVLFCSACQSLWRRVFDRQEDRHSAVLLPASYLPLFGAAPTPHDLIEAILAPDFDTRSFSLVLDERHRLLVDGHYDPAAAARDVVATLGRPGLDLPQAHALVDLFAGLVDRAVRDLRKPVREPKPIANLSRGEMVEELAQWYEESHRRWDSLSAAAPPKGEADPAETRLSLDSVSALVAPLADLERPGGGSPAQRVAHRMTMRSLLEQVLLSALDGPHRARLLSLPDDQWDALGAALDRKVRLGAVVEAIAAGVPRLLSANAPRLAELCAEVHALLRLKAPDGLPERLRLPRSGLAAGQRAALQRALSALQASGSADAWVVPSVYELRCALAIR